MTYSEILKKVREECDMTQAEFAMYFSVPKRTYQDWEYGASEVQAAKAKPKLSVKANTLTVGKTYKIKLNNYSYL